MNILFKELVFKLFLTLILVISSEYIYVNVIDKKQNKKYILIKINFDRFQFKRKKFI
jgi:hypothetical protein